MKSQTFYVCGLPLPPALAHSLVEGTWVTPAYDVLLDVFQVQPWNPRFYSAAGMESETKNIRSLVDPEEVELFSGEPSAVDPPGDIDAALAVIIGDLCPDMPIALDYRASAEDPPVAFLSDSGWKYVAPTTKDFISRISKSR